jgi:hypothetical protein
MKNTKNDDIQIPRNPRIYYLYYLSEACKRCCEPRHFLLLIEQVSARNALRSPDR